MLFNSVEFLIFLPTIFCIYWFFLQKNLRAQNLLLLFSSYVFYGWWDWKFLSLIFLSTVIDYFIGLKVYNSKTQNEKKIYLSVSIFFNLGLLGFFKYFNFFIESWIDFLSIFSYHVENPWTLKVILPVGISFYTFQTISYSIDIYYGNLKPTKDFESFALFVSFFPQLVAGPIERASNLLPQILTTRVFRHEQGVDGLRLILWGLFKKIVIADSIAWRVDYCFQNYSSLDGGTLFLGLIYFSFQLYCDFSGYSDIAIGTAKLFGLEIMSNFKFPLFSLNVHQFWERWHISLTSWIKDYIYTPLALNFIRKGKSLYNVNIAFVITWLLTGLWHGANYTFICWGIYWCIILLLHKYYKHLIQKHIENKKLIKKIKPNILNVFNHLILLKKIFNVCTTFIFVSLSWVFFRSENITKSFHYLSKMLSEISFPTTNKGGLVIIIIFIILEFMFRKNERKIINFKYIYIRWFFYFTFSFFCFSHFHFFDEINFLYYQF